MSSETVTKTRRPKDSPFFQQRLPAWQPLFTAKKSAITFIVLGLIFIPLGAVLYVTANSVIEYTWDYTDCTDASGQICSTAIASPSACTCTKTINVESDIPGPVYLYYGLNNFYQNHRRYARSRNDAQLLGQKVSVDSLSSCDPFSIVTENSVKRAILPCGAIANSIFNDTFTINYHASGSTASVSVPMTAKDISWNSDRERRFGTLTPEALVDTVKPPSWNMSIEQRSPGAFKTDEELMVWMRVSALPNFRKLHRRILHTGQFEKGLPAGAYQVSIKYVYPVVGFGGKKLLVLGNVSWLGGKNVTLGVTCLFTGCLYLAIGIAFLAIYLRTNNRTVRLRIPGFG